MSTRSRKSRAADLLEKIDELANPKQGTGGAHGVRKTQADWRRLDRPTQPNQVPLLLPHNRNQQKKNGRRTPRMLLATWPQTEHGQEIKWKTGTTHTELTSSRKWECFDKEKQRQERKPVDTSTEQFLRSRCNKED
jgi:hypothetical protein